MSKPTETLGGDVRVVMAMSVEGINGNMQHSPSRRTRLLENTKKGAEFLELETSERLCEGIRNHIVGRTVGQVDVALGDGLADKVEMNVDMFGAAVERGVL